MITKKQTKTKTIRKAATTLAILGGVLLSQSAFAAEIDVKITNLTQGIYFTPVIVAAHTSDASVYTLGTAASDELQMMAEGGDISGLSTALTAASADLLENPAAGLLAPGTATEGELSTADTNLCLLVASILLPTNDGFAIYSSYFSNLL